MISNGRQCCFLMQGPSGSGKSTRAREIAKEHNAVICSTDDFHYVNGTYVWDRTNLAYYHAWNIWQVEQHLLDGRNVVVDNCNLTQKDVQPYIDLARKLNVSVQVIRCEGRFDNEHGVPREAVERMITRMERLMV